MYKYIDYRPLVALNSFEIAFKRRSFIKSISLHKERRDSNNNNRVSVNIFEFLFEWDQRWSKDVWSSLESALELIKDNIKLLIISFFVHSSTHFLAHNLRGNLNNTSSICIANQKLSGLGNWELLWIAFVFGVFRRREIIACEVKTFTAAKIHRFHSLYLRNYQLECV